MSFFNVPVHGCGAVVCTLCSCLLPWDGNSGSLRLHCSRHHPNRVFSAEAAASLAVNVGTAPSRATFHVNNSSPVLPISGVPVVNAFQCSFCNHISGKRNTYRRHIRSSHNASSSDYPPVSIFAHHYGNSFLWVSDDSARHAPSSSSSSSSSSRAVAASTFPSRSALALPARAPAPSRVRKHRPLRLLSDEDDDMEMNDHFDNSEQDPQQDIHGEDYAEYDNYEGKENGEEEDDDDEYYCEEFEEGEGEDDYCEDESYYHEEQEGDLLLDAGVIDDSPSFEFDRIDSASSCFLPNVQTSSEAFRVHTVHELTNTTMNRSLISSLSWWNTHDGDVPMQSAFLKAIETSPQNEQETALYDLTRRWFDTACTHLKSADINFRTVLQYGKADNFSRSIAIPQNAAILQERVLFACRLVLFAHRVFLSVGSEDERFFPVLPTPSSINLQNTIQSFFFTVLSSPMKKGSYLTDAFLKSYALLRRDSVTAVRKACNHIKFLFRIAIAFDYYVLHDESFCPSPDVSRERHALYMTLLERGVNCFSSVRGIASDCDAIEKLSSTPVTLSQTWNGVMVNGVLIENGSYSSTFQSLLITLHCMKRKLFLSATIPSPTCITVHDNPFEISSFYCAGFSGGRTSKSYKRKRNNSSSSFPSSSSTSPSASSSVPCLQHNDFADYILNSILEADKDHPVLYNDSTVFKRPGSDTISRSAAMDWCQTFEKFLSLLAVSVHISSGYPARASEFTTTSFFNTSSIKRTVTFDTETNTWVNSISYSKTRKGCRLVHRWIHPDLSHLLTLTLSCLHPFYRYLGINLEEITPSEFCPQLFQSKWKPLSTVHFRNAFTTTLSTTSTPLSIRTHRQYLAYQLSSTTMKYIHNTLFSQLLTRSSTSDSHRSLLLHLLQSAFSLTMQDSSHRQFGHTSETGEQSYGITPLDDSSSHRQRMIQSLCSQTVHLLCTLPTPNAISSSSSSSSSSTSSASYPFSSSSSSPMPSSISHQHPVSSPNIPLNSPLDSFFTPSPSPSSVPTTQEMTPSTDLHDTHLYNHIPSSFRSSTYFNASSSSSTSLLSPSTTTTHTPSSLESHLRGLLSHYCSFSNFSCQEQLDSCIAAVEGKHVFLTMATGAGKTISYFLPVLCDNLITVVIVPLRALARQLEERLNIYSGPLRLARWWNSETSSSLEQILLAVIASTTSTSSTTSVHSVPLTFRILLTTPEQFRSSPSSSSIINPNFFSFSSFCFTPKFTSLSSPSSFRY